MFRTLTLTSLLVLTFNVGGALVDAPWISDAEARCKGCDPRIKRGKLVIKKRRVGTVVKLPPVPPSGNTWSNQDGPPTGGVTLTVAGATPVSAVDPIRAVTVFSGSLPEGTTLEDYTLDVKVRDEALATELAVDFEAPLTLDESGVTVSGGSKVIHRVLGDGTLRFRIRNQDRDWDPTFIESASLVPAEGEPIALSNDFIEARFFAPLPDDFVFDAPVPVTAELLDEDGVVIQTVSRTLSPETDAISPTLDRARLSETRRGDARLATWTVTDGSPVSLDVVVVDDATGEVVVEALDEAPVRAIRTFESGTFTFEGGEDPVGTTYLLQVDLFDAEGQPVGNQHEVELTMPEHVAGETTEAFVPYGGEDALGVVGVMVDDEGFTLSATSEDDTVTEVDIVFLEPFEGPAPLALESTLGLSAIYERWVQKGSGPLPESCSVTSTLIDVDGAAVDSVIVGGIGSGNVYSAGGKGTSINLTRGLQNHLELL
jgi:hypothetical protein